MDDLKTLICRLAIITALISTSAFAQWIPGGGGSSGGSGGGAPLLRGFYFSLAAKGGLSKVASSDNEAVESRDLWSFGGEITAGVRAFGLMFGASGEYLMLKQREDPDDVDGTNASGTQLTIAPTIGVPFARFLFQVRPHFYSTYTLDRKTAGGDEVEYSSPELPSYTAQLVYAIGSSFVGLEYTSMTYKKRSEGGEEVTLDTDDKLTIGTLGVVYGYKF